MKVLPFGGKANIKETYRGYQIEIPAPRNWFILLFLTTWLGGWAIGWCFAFFAIISNMGNALIGVNLFLLFWLIGWTFGGLVAIRTWLWMLFGKEIISIENNYLDITRKGDLLSKTKQYDLKKATNFEVVDTPSFGYFSNGFANQPYNSASAGTLKFDYGLKTIRFGIGIDGAEGRFLLKQFRAKGLIVAS